MAPVRTHRTADLLLDLGRDYIRFARWRAALALLLQGSATVLEGAGLLMLVPLLAVVTGAHAGRLQPLEHIAFQAAGARDASGRLIVLLVAFAILLVLRATATLARDRVLARLKVDYIAARRGDLIALLTAASWERLMRLQHADVAEAVGTDVPRLQALVATGSQMITSAFLLLSAATVGVALLPALALLILPLLAAMGVVMASRAAAARTTGRRMDVSAKRMVHNAAQFLGGLKFAISHDVGASFRRQQATLTDALGRQQLAQAREQSCSRVAAVSLTAALGGAATFVGFSVLHLSAPVLLVLVAVLSRVSGPAIALQQSFQQLLYDLAYYEHLLSLRATLAAPEAGPETPAVARVAAQAVATAPVDATVRFKGVTYLHRGADGAPSGGVEGLSFEIAPGEVVALSGPSGAGKTTTADLIAGLLAPQSGSIEVGGRPLDASTVQAWRRLLSYVPQDAALHDATVSQNLKLGAPDARPAEIDAALAVTGADRVVAALLAGLETRVGERGGLLSGGERQRLVLARALLRQPALLLLDEATNALDIVGERDVLARLAALQPRPTILVISHRRETRELCGREIRLD